MVGAVNDTNFFSRTAPYQLPPSSIYRPIENIIADADAGKLNPDGSNVDAFATELVKDILGGTRGQIWKGKMASMSKFVTTWVPWRLLDGMVGNGRGIDVLAGSVQGGKG